MARLNQAMNDLIRYNAALQPGKRSTFNKSHSHTTTFDSGNIIPIFWDRVVPGDEKQLQISALVRMATPLHPVMDGAFVDVHCFYVPDRLWWNHAKEFYGENLDADFNPDGEYVMPYLKPSWYTSSYTGTLSDYFGFPCVTENHVEDVDFTERDANTQLYATAGLHRSYQLIWNEYYRNSSIQPALLLNTGDEVGESEFLEVLNVVRKSNRLPDIYTTLLREPQAGPDVLLPLGEWAPVVATDDYINNFTNTLHFVDANGNEFSGMNHALGISGGSSKLVVATDAVDELGSINFAYPNNLWANLNDVTGAGTINQLRNAITIQHFLEIQNRAGRRYQSIIQSFFGVFTPDATLQRPELLGVSRTRLGMRQVIQTGETSDSSPLGNTGAISITNFNNEWICNKSFTEPGFIIALATVRPVVSYSQGLNPLLTKLRTYEHYWPCFEGIGNQPVYKYELYNGYNISSEDLTSVLGYKEAYMEYKTIQNRVSGLLRPDVNQSLSSWVYTMDFDGNMALNSQFIEQDKSTIDKTIAVTNQPQFIGDFYFEYKDTKNMSLHSVPGVDKI